MTARLRIGTAGWSIPSRYAADVPPGSSHLARYARCLNAVEINTSFYRPHRQKTYARWAASVSDDFRFAVKVPKSVTHDHALADCKADLARFLDEVAGLGAKLAVFLVQLPPRLAFDAAAMSAFFDLLAERSTVPVALEPRHPSWFATDVDRWLARRKIARVAADPAKIAGADDPGGWDGLRYFRWHGSPRVYYSDYDCAALAGLKRRLAQATGDVWCVFDNTASGAALGNALVLSRS